MSPFSRSEKTLLFINVTAVDLALVTAHNTAYDTVNVLYCVIFTVQPCWSGLS